MGSKLADSSALRASRSLQAAGGGPEKPVETRAAAARPLSEQVCAGVDAARAGDGVLGGIRRVLMQWAHTPAARTMNGTTRFDSVRASAMPIGCYLDRLRKYFECSEECYVLALVYIERVGGSFPPMAACVLNIHRLLLVALMLAAKFHDDDVLGSSLYAAIGGVAVDELNALEKTFLKALDWRLSVEPEEYDLYREQMCVAADKFSSLSSGHDEDTGQSHAI